MSELAITGDLVSRSKGILLRHWGVYLGGDQVLHNSPECGEHVSGLDEFASGHEVQIHPVASEKRPWVIESALKVLANPKGYDIFRNNCEHTANRIVIGQACSPQLRLVLVVLAVGILLRAYKA